MNLDVLSFKLRTIFRDYLTVAIGCKDGQHRSVYFVESLGQWFRDTEQVLVRHRELS